ncbi:hypothetical protein [Micromonospora sp. DT227]|uniref:hypothetical protein n=1 Tax=Micromonospora sp. DT227 TaxID=3393433 RepID=UPI003CF2377F
MTQSWYTVTVVRHEKHPRDYVEGDATKPIEVVSCTVLPALAAGVLRLAADEIAPPKSVMRGRSEP